MSFQPILMICTITAATLTWVICPFFSLSFLRVPKEMKDPQWVGFHPGTHSYEIFGFFFFFFAAQKRSQSNQFSSINVAVVHSNISQYAFEQDHLTTLCRVITSNPLSTSSTNHLLYHIVLPVVTWASSTSNTTPPPIPLHTNAWKRSTQTWKQFHASAINLNSLSSRGQLHFLLFCCTVIFHQDVNLTF